MMHIAAFAAPVLLHRTSHQYDSVRSSLLPWTTHHLENPERAMISHHSFNRM